MRAIHHAIENGQEAAALFLIQHNCDVNASCEDGLTPLMLAARRGMVVVMEALLAKGAWINATDDHGERALHHAIKNGQEAAALFLIGWCRPCNVQSPN